MTPLLTVGYSCLADRLGNLTLPDVRDDVEVVVAVQGDDPPGAGPLPPGARLVRVAGHGVARSRNAVIDEARGRFLLFCDDDVLVDMPGVSAGVEHLERSGHAIVVGRGVDPSGQPRKAYPADVTRLTTFNSAKVATYEMLVDVFQIRSAGVRFDERFGAGAPLYLADEYLFVVDLLRAGLTGDAIPVVFGCHPATSSGQRWETERDAHVRAVALNRVFGRAAPVVRTAFAVKHRRQIGGVRRLVRFITDGARPPAAKPGDVIDDVTR